MIKIIPATTLSQYTEIARLASIIWNQHYTAIIGQAQVDYMLDKFQSVEAIKHQITDNYFYFILQYDNIPAGYIAIKPEQKSLFLSKIYVLEDFRGKKIGKTAMQFIEDRAITENLSAIRLTVNKNNVNSISAYQKLGFVITRSLIVDIGNGYVMDDYEMVKEVKS